MKNGLPALLIGALCIASSAQEGETNMQPAGCNTTTPIVLSTLGLCLSASAIPSPIIGLTGAVDDTQGKKVYGYAVGPGLNLIGGILSGISLRMLDNQCNRDGSVLEASVQRDKVKRLVSIGSALGSVAFLGLILFMEEPNDLALRIAVPVPIAGTVLNSVAGIKALRTSVQFKKGTLGEKQD